MPDHISPRTLARWKRAGREFTIIESPLEAEWRAERERAAEVMREDIERHIEGDDGA